MGKKGPRAKIKTVLKSVDMDMVTTWPGACKLTILKLIKIRAEQSQRKRIVELKSVRFSLFAAHQLCVTS